MFSCQISLGFVNDMVIINKNNKIGNYIHITYANMFFI